MTTDEAVKIIALFDGWVISKSETVKGRELFERDGISLSIAGIYQRYLSLDVLVPAWEKLDKIHGIRCYFPEKEFILLNDHLIQNASRGETIQQAACLATAKAIQSLEDK